LKNTKTKNKPNELFGYCKKYSSNSVCWQAQCENLENTEKTTKFLQTFPNTWVDYISAFTMYRLWYSHLVLIHAMLLWHFSFFSEQNDQHPNSIKQKMTCMPCLLEKQSKQIVEHTSSKAAMVARHRVILEVNIEVVGELISSLVSVKKSMTDI